MDLGGSSNRVSRLTARQRRQVASLYGKAPRPMGTWEPLPNLTKEETDQILQEFEQQMKANAVPLHSEDLQSGRGRGLQRGTVEASTRRVDYTQNLSSPSLLQRSTNSASERRMVTEYKETMPPHSSSVQYHTRPSVDTVVQQPPSGLLYGDHLHTSGSNYWTGYHPTAYEQHHTQLHSQTMMTPTHSQQYGTPSSNNWTTCNEVTSSAVSSHLNTTIHYTTTDERAPSPSYMITTTASLNRPPSPIKSSSSQWPTDYQAPSANWTRSDDSVDYQSTHQLQPFYSASSCYNYSSQRDFTSSPTSHSVSQLSPDLTSLGITLNISSIEDVSNVDCSLLVVGVTGSGKSSACNFFIGSDVFNTAEGAIAVTAKSDAHIQSILGKQVLFIDTPGFGDEFVSDEIRMAELGRAILFARDGVNAIVLCMDGSRRFDSSIANLLQEFEVLGAFWPYTFIMYTHAADMGQTEEEQKFKISQWLHNPRCPDRMKWLFEKVCHRCMTVESKHFRNNADYYRHKCQELLNMVETISAHNQHQKYTNQFFQWAKKKYDQVKQKKLEHERKLEETQKSLQKYQNFVKLVERNLQQKQQQFTEFVTKQQQYINSLEAQLRSCREEERMRIQVEREEAKHELTDRVQGHQELLSGYSASKEKMLAKYDEDAEKCKEHEWQSNRIPMELFLDEVRYELYASNRERRELRDQLVCVNATLQQMQEEKAQSQKKQGSSMYGVVVDGAKIVAPMVARSYCSIM